MAAVAVHKRKFVEKILKCTVCKDFSISPIHSCRKGHIVCRACLDLLPGQTEKRCRKKDGKSTKNRKRYNSRLKPNGFSDFLAVRHHGFQIPCKNAASGCTLSWTSRNMYEHLLQCQYSPVACFEKVVDRSCKQKYCPLKDFWEHLETAHNFTAIEPRDSKSSGTFEVTNALAVTASDTSYPASCFKFDGKVFIYHLQSTDFGVYSWLTLIGGEDDAKAYVYNTSIIGSAKPEVQHGQCSFDFPVLPIKGYQYFEAVRDKGLFTGIHVDALKPLCSPNQDGSGGVFWTTKVEITKLEV